VKETALYCRGDGLGAPVDGETLEDRAKMPFYAIFADTQYVAVGAYYFWRNRYRKNFIDPDTAEI